LKEFVMLSRRSFLPLGVGGLAAAATHRTQAQSQEVPSPAAPSGTLLFKTDWGGTTSIGNPIGLPANNAWWPIQGTDKGFTWPPNVYNSIGNGIANSLHPIHTNVTLQWSAENPTYITRTSDGADVFRAQIINRARYDDPSGNSRVLHTAVFRPFEDSMQLPYEIHPAADVTDCYILMDLEFDANMARLQPIGRWQSFMAWKTSDYNLGEGYRIEIYIYRDSTGFYWYMHGDNNPSTLGFWQQRSRVPAVPLGVPFRFEWAWHRTYDNNCWTWVKVNGRRCMRQDGQGSNQHAHSGTRPSGFQTAGSTGNIDRILLNIIYGDITFPCHRYLGHFEIWSGAPVW
jgi:hypothetical protein